MQAGQRMRRRERAQGFALVVVLMMLSALAVIALSYAGAARTETKVAANEIANAQARALADAGVMLAVAQLLDGKDGEDGEDGESIIDGRPQVVPFAGVDLDIIVQAETGKIDLNTAPESLLKGLFEAAGLPSNEAASFADRIADWRDDNDLRRPFGAEAPDYGENDPGPPAAGGFAHVHELNRVLGMTAELFAKVAPALTVHSGRQGFNPRVAPRSVLLSVLGAQPDVVDTFLEARGQEAGGNQQLPFGDGDLINVEVGPVYTIQAQANSEGSGRFVREAVIWIPKSGERPYWVLDWRAGRSLD